MGTKFTVVVIAILASVWIAHPAIAEDSPPSVEPAHEQVKPTSTNLPCPDIETTVSDDAEVWWGNRGRAFGPYLQFARAEIPDVSAWDDERLPEFPSIYFELDRAVLQPEGIETAEALREFLNAHLSATVRLEGNCCDLYTWDYNIALGKQRAEAVKRYLVAQGIAPERIETVSFGKGQLVTTDPELRPLNRRVDIILKQDEAN